MNYSLIIKQFKNKKILVVGDIILDEYIYGTSKRLSPEAPVPVIERSDKHISLGGSANVANNLKKLGVKTFLIGTVGNDHYGTLLTQLIKKEGFDFKNIINDSRKFTTVKTRIISNGQHIARIDNEDSSDISLSLQNQILSRVLKTVSIQKPDALIISDYNKGIITKKISKEIIKIAKKYGSFVFVDPKGEDFSKYKGADLITPNKKETEIVTGISLNNENRIKYALKKLLLLCGANSVLITRGKEGISFLNSNKIFKTVPAQKVNVYDVTGAGDTFISVFTLSFIISGSWEHSAVLANLASSIVISSMGTTFTTPDELFRATASKDENSKIVKLADLKKILSSSGKEKNKNIIFTNGCFDLLHAGHIRVLKESKKLDGTLVVAINSDNSVRKLKGKGRPVVKEKERAHLIALMDEVDFVIIFNELTPLKIIKEIKPDFITKGGDYKKREIVGSEFVERNGGKVITIPLLKDLSTTNMLKKIKAS